MLRQEQIALLPQPQMAAAEYRVPCFEQYFGKHRTLPIVECARPAGNPLPARASELVRAGMCCVLEHARLWPAAEEKWGRAAYLRSELRDCPCAVLSSPASSKRFSYWFDQASYGSDRVAAGYEAKPLVCSSTMSIEQYLDAQKPMHLPRHSCLYLQQSILQAPADGSAQQGNLLPCAGLGEGIKRDLASGIDLSALKALAQAGGFGPWQRCQLFVGGSSTIGARSILHFDQYDNLFVQISGRKRFRIYDPQQTRCLYPYPIHHPLDTRAQVDLEAAFGGGDEMQRFPKLRHARCSEVVLGPGQVLFLPAYWWHEVLTLEPEPMPLGNECRTVEGGADNLVVSVNFWFAAVTRLLTPTRPLVPSMQCELARQLEYLISDSLADRAHLVPTFLRALTAGMEAVRAHASEGVQSVAAAASEALQAHRPSEVQADDWSGLFEFVLIKLSLLIGHRHVLSFCHDLLDPGRFAHLKLWGTKSLQGSRRV